MDLIEKARALRRGGALDEAAKCYRQALDHQPQKTDALCELGTVSLLQGRLHEALDLLERALQINPKNFDALLTKSNTLVAMNRFSEALTGFEEALKIRPDSTEAHNNRGGVLAMLNRTTEALLSFEKAIQLKADYVDAYKNRGAALRTLGRHADVTVNEAAQLHALKRDREALAPLDRAIAENPNHVDGHLLRAEILEKLRRPQEALECLDRALALRTPSADLYLRRATLLFKLSRHSDALDDSNRALSIQPDLCDALNKRGQALISLGRPEAALESFEKALAIKCDSLDALNGRGFVLGRMARWGEALACYETALLLYPASPEAQGNMALTLLALGRFAEGWQRFEWRWKTQSNRKTLRKFAQTRWLGQVPIAGKTLLLYPEQGFGDTLQMVRYVPLLAKAGARVIAQVQAPLVPVLKGLEGAERVICLGSPLPSFDLHCPLMSLPLAFGTTLETIPSRTPYLSAQPEQLAAWAERLGRATGPRIGIAWSGNPKHGNDRNRSMHLKELLPLLSEGTEVVSLQKDVREIDRDILKTHSQIRDFSAALKDFADTAALISLLDLVISVDTAPAHLAGALAKPVWILLPFSPDWRWLLDRKDSPWYPTARLFRQPVFGDWDSVIRKIREELRCYFASSESTDSRVTS